MEKAILAIYSGLSITSLMCFLVSTLVLERLIRRRSFDSTFYITLSISMFWFSEFGLRTWWTFWKDRKMANQASEWMVNHGIVLFLCLLMIASGIILIKALTEEIGDMKVLIFTLVIVSYVAFFVYILR